MTELIILGVIAALLLALTLWKRESPRVLREIPALARLHRAMGLSVEDGTRLHISLGSASLLTPRGGSALAALAALRNIAERTSSSDQPPVASSGDPLLALLSQDTLQAGYVVAGAEGLYTPTSGRLTGMSPFGFAAGVMPILRDENVSANIMLGHFGPEAGLIVDSAERANAVNIGASNELTAQSILFASAQEPLIGEELYATSAYLSAEASHIASLTVQDILRWIIIFLLLASAGAKFLGMI